VEAGKWGDPLLGLNGDGKRLKKKIWSPHLVKESQWEWKLKKVIPGVETNSRKAREEKLKSLVSQL